jgi:hypothetical protein
VFCLATRATGARFGRGNRNLGHRGERRLHGRAERDAVGGRSQSDGPIAIDARDGLGWMDRGQDALPTKGK